ncbi:MAG: hypothetical protein LV480_09525 [Methylacidiphilales bacterium]|nr:hypothetical protein [Candidatus Methylacidiphilales bacterium]
MSTSITESFFFPVRHPERSEAKDFLSSRWSRPSAVEGTGHFSLVPKFAALRRSLGTRLFAKLRFAASATKLQGHGTDLIQPLQGWTLGQPTQGRPCRANPGLYDNNPFGVAEETAIFGQLTTLKELLWVQLISVPAIACAVFATLKGLLRVQLISVPAIACAVFATLKETSAKIPLLPSVILSGARRTILLSAADGPERSRRTSRFSPQMSEADSARSKPSRSAALSGQDFSVRTAGRLRLHRSFDSGSLLRRAVTASQRNNCHAQHLAVAQDDGAFLNGALSQRSPKGWPSETAIFGQLTTLKELLWVQLISVPAIACAVFATLKGWPSFSPGLRGTSYPGFIAIRANPEGVESKSGGNP